MSLPLCDGIEGTELLIFKKKTFNSKKCKSKTLLYRVLSIIF